MATIGGDVAMIPGFYFQPTDEQLMTYYLLKKFRGETFRGSDLILDFDVYSTEPWHLPRSFYSKDGKSYYFLLAKRSSLGCTRLLRQAGNGYWHMNGTTKKIYDSNNVLVGTTTALTYMATTEGAGKKKKKTKWVMHEYRLDPSYFDKSKPQTVELVLCSIQESGRGEATQQSCNIENNPQPLMLAAPQTTTVPLQKSPREDNTILFQEYYSGRGEATDHQCYYENLPTEPLLLAAPQTATTLLQKRPREDNPIDVQDHETEWLNHHGVLKRTREGGLLEDVVAGCSSSNPPPFRSTAAAAGLDHNLGTGDQELIQYIDSFLNNDEVDEPLQDNDCMGLAIPMDNLSDLFI